MRSLKAALLLLLSFSFFAANAQPPVAPDGGLKQPRILILLDGSSSMLQPWNEDTRDNRFATAGRLITSLIDSIYQINGAVEFALRVYGHQSPAQEKNCYDTKKEVMFSRNNLTQMGLRVASLQPRGVSPIAYSLQKAAEQDLEADYKNAYSIILITDGSESCEGDICKVTELLLKKKIFFRPYIISLAAHKELKDQYACLGTYLQATNDAELTAAIKSIAEEYRPLLTLPTMKIKPAAVTMPVLPKMSPTALTVSIPKWEAERANAVFIPVARNTRLLPVRIFGAPAVLKKNALPPAPVLRPMPAEPAIAVKRDTVIPKPVLPKAVPVVAKTDTIAPKPAPKATTVNIVKVDPPKATTPPPVKTTPPPSKPVGETYIKEVEEAAETTLAIFFTDGHGKYYKTEPELELTNPTTGAVVKKFYRNVNRATGQPDEMKLEAGTYNLILPGKNKMLYRNIVIEEKKKNKITVKVAQGSLKFEYEGAPRRQVTEFKALVKKNFQPGPAIEQNCTAELPYDAGNYHIEINTLPVTVRMVDIAFGELVAISIPEPGFLQVMNSIPMGEAGMFRTLGDRFVQFYTLPLSGNAATQKLQLQPGTYEIRWKKAPGAKESVQRFVVKSNAVTQIELEQ